MGEASVQHLIELVAAVSARQNLSVGCYCEHEARCHRSLLKDLLQKAGGVIEDQ